MFHEIIWRFWMGVGRRRFWVLGTGADETRQEVLQYSTQDGLLARLLACSFTAGGSVVCGTGICGRALATGEVSDHARPAGPVLLCKARYLRIGANTVVLQYCRTTVL